MDPDSHIMSFMALKGLRVIHIPGSLVGYEPQVTSILNSAERGCQLNTTRRLNLTWHQMANMGCESDDVEDKAQRESGSIK